MTGNNVPKISIVIVNWNGKKYIRQCLRSIIASNYPKDKLEIIVVDNASNDGSDQIIAREFPEVILIRNEQNLGFCEANNIGIRHSKGNVIVLLNNDTFVHNEWLNEIVKIINDPHVGIVGCRLLYPDGKIIQSCGCKELFPGYWIHIAAGLTIDEFRMEKEFEVDYVCGAAMAVKRELFDKIGLLDSRFFSYVEDVDICYRARSAGYKVIIAPKAIVYHHSSASWKKFPLKRFLLDYRNRFFFIYKNYPKKLLRYVLGYPIKIHINCITKLSKERNSNSKITSRLPCEEASILKHILTEYILNTFFFTLSFIIAPYYIKKFYGHSKNDVVHNQLQCLKS
jgi:GT2 family glycosyltransferase